MPGKGIIPWINKELILVSDFLNMYILDIEKGQVRLFPSYEYEYEYEWLFLPIRFDISPEWDYLSYIDGKVIGLRRNIKRDELGSEFIMELIVDGVIADARPYFEILCAGREYVVTNYGEVIKIDTENFKFDDTFKLWVDYYDYSSFLANFRKNGRYDENIGDDDFVSYSEKDLIGGR
jgi:hypothetical protein